MGQPHGQILSISMISDRSMREVMLDLKAISEKDRSFEWAALRGKMSERECQEFEHWLANTKDQNLREDYETIERSSRKIQHWGS